MGKFTLIRDEPFSRPETLTAAVAFAVVLSCIKGRLPVPGFFLHPQGNSCQQVKSRLRSVCFIIVLIQDIGALKKDFGVDPPDFF